MASLDCINYQTAIKRVKVYDGRNPEEFLEWKSNLRIASGTCKTALFKLLAGALTRPEPAATGEGENNDREYFGVRPRRRGTLQRTLL